VDGSVDFSAVAVCKKMMRVRRSQRKNKSTAKQIRRQRHVRVYFSLATAAAAAADNA
jgi:VanZ family protein